MNLLKLITCMLCIIGSTLVADQMPEPYRSINDLPFDGHGWFGNAEPVKKLLNIKPAKIVIEVGSWLGSSTRFIGKEIPDDGIVYAIDTWAGSPLEAVHQQDPRLPYLYQLFLSNVKHAGLTHKIIPHRMNSMEASKALNISADLIYLDAAHDFQSVKDDIMNWYPHLAEEGIMCGDDWDWEGVQAAVKECAGLLGKKIQHVKNFWWYE